MNHFQQYEVDSPLGLLDVITSDAVVCGLEFRDHEDRLHRLLKRYYGQFTCHAGQQPHPAVARLQAYFAGDLAVIQHIPVKTNGTAFQQHVWATLRTIPIGQPWTYGQLAQHVGRPTAFRAVGNANGSNVISIIIPCHRVIATNGLGGYGGGLPRKEWLLQHERNVGGIAHQSPTLPSV